MPESDTMPHRPLPQPRIDTRRTAAARARQRGATPVDIEGTRRTVTPLLAELREHANRVAPVTSHIRSIDHELERIHPDGWFHARLLVEMPIGPLRKIIDRHVQANRDDLEVTVLRW